MNNVLVYMALAVIAFCIATLPYWYKVRKRTTPRTLTRAVLSCSHPPPRTRRGGEGGKG